MKTLSVNGFPLDLDLVAIKVEYMSVYGTDVELTFSVKNEQLGINDTVSKKELVMGYEGDADYLYEMDDEELKDAGYLFSSADLEAYDEYSSDNLPADIHDAIKKVVDEAIENDEEMYRDYLEQEDEYWYERIEKMTEDEFRDFLRDGQECGEHRSRYNGCLSDIEQLVDNCIDRQIVGIASFYDQEPVAELSVNGRVVRYEASDGSELKRFVRKRTIEADPNEEWYIDGGGLYSEYIFHGGNQVLSVNGKPIPPDLCYWPQKGDVIEYYDYDEPSSAD